LTTSPLVVVLISTLWVVAARGQAPEGFVQLGEGRSSVDPAGTIEFASPRMFTMYLLDEACRVSHAGSVTRLRAGATPAMRVGERFSPARLRVVAFDSAGRVVPRVPIAVELRAPAGFFDPKLRDAMGSGPLVPLVRGTASFRARTVCPGTPVEVSIDTNAR
jgi:hypothetical protein